MQPTTISTTNPITENYIKCVCALNNIEVVEVDGGVVMVNPTTDVYNRINRYVGTGNRLSKNNQEKVTLGE